MIVGVYLSMYIETYSLDDLSDDEDYMPAVQGNTPGTSGGSGSATITASQLAQALASTSTSVTPQQSQVSLQGN